MRDEGGHWRKVRESHPQGGEVSSRERGRGEKGGPGVEKRGRNGEPRKDRTSHGKEKGIKGEFTTVRSGERRPEKRKGGNKKKRGEGKVGKKGLEKKKTPTKVEQTVTMTQ